MKLKIVETKNLRRFRQGVDELLNRPPNDGKINQLWGPPGTGKSTALAYTAGIYGGVFIRATAQWTATSMLERLCEELDCDGDDMLKAIICELTKDNAKPRPILIDEADYCFRHSDMIDLLCDIHEQTGCPVVLSCMGNIVSKISELDCRSKRVTQWNEFSGLDMEDTSLVVNELSEVDLSPDQIQQICEQTNGYIGRVAASISKIEKNAQLDGIRQ